MEAGLHGTGFQSSFLKLYSCYSYLFYWVKDLDKSWFQSSFLKLYSCYDFQNDTHTLRPSYFNLLFWSYILAISKMAVTENYGDNISIFFSEAIFLLFYWYMTIIRNSIKEFQSSFLKLYSCYRKGFLSLLHREKYPFQSSFLKLYSCYYRVIITNAG